MKDGIGGRPGSSEASGVAKAQVSFEEGMLGDVAPMQPSEVPGSPVSNRKKARSCMDSVGPELMEFVDGFNLNMGQDMGSSCKDDPILICEVGHGLGWKYGGTMEPTNQSTFSILEKVAGLVVGLDLGPNGSSDTGLEARGTGVGDTVEPNQNSMVHATGGSLGDPGAMPAMAPSSGFKWHFLSKFWALVPVNFSSHLGLEHNEGDGSDIHMAVNASPKIISESDDSSTEFERNLRVLLPNLHSEKDTKLPAGTRRSERPKNPQQGSMKKWSR